LRPEVLEGYLFGSTARREQQAHSDVDVAVYVDLELAPAAPYGYSASLATDLMAAAGGRGVDVVVLNEAPPLLYGRVLRDGIRLIARDLAATTGREGRALSRYCDFVPQMAKIDAAHRARIARGDFGR
jgi:predicted nucleotidyltransferase